jgi:hypothetical protein
LDVFEEAKMLDLLREKPSSLCERCEDYKILNVFELEEIVDITDNSSRIRSINHTANVMTDWVEEQQKHNLVLGYYHSIKLYGSCPLCRLIFRIFPTRNEDDVNEQTIYYVRPFPSYDRQNSFLKETNKNLKAQYAINFYVESGEKAFGNVMTNFADLDSQMINQMVESFALSNKNSETTRKALRARKRGDMVDFELLRNWIERCASTHGVSCHRTWSDELLTTRMIDTSTRQIVQYPAGCEYVALSYVWGGVVPEENALENRRLPQTIEDTITATQRLGIKYLWVKLIVRRQLTCLTHSRWMLCVSIKGLVPLKRSNSQSWTSYTSALRSRL